MVHVVIVLFMAVVDDGSFIFHGKFVFLAWSLFLNQVVFCGSPVSHIEKKFILQYGLYNVLCI